MGPGGLQRMVSTVMMDVMADKKPTKAKSRRAGDRHINKPLQLRLHPSLRQQLRLLADQNLTTMTAEVVAAIRDRLKSQGLWPPPSKPDS